MAPEIEQSALADASAGAKGTDEAMGEIGFAVGGRAGLSAADEHGISRRYGAGEWRSMPPITIMALHWSIPRFEGQKPLYTGSNHQKSPEIKAQRLWAR